MKRIKISLDMSLLDVATTMAEGNPGGASVIGDLLSPDSQDGLLKLLNLDDMNMRGVQIWVGYKDYCGEDIAEFRTAITDRDPEMIRAVNAACLYPGFTEKAVISGASFD